MRFARCHESRCRTTSQPPASARSLRSQAANPPAMMAPLYAWRCARGGSLLAAAQAADTSASPTASHTTSSAQAVSIADHLTATPTARDAALAARDCSISRRSRASTKPPSTAARQAAAGTRYRCLQISHLLVSCRPRILLICHACKQLYEQGGRGVGVSEFHRRQGALVRVARPLLLLPSHPPARILPKLHRRLRPTAAAGLYEQVGEPSGRRMGWFQTDAALRLFLHIGHGVTACDSASSRYFAKSPSPPCTLVQYNHLSERKTASASCKTPALQRLARWRRCGTEKNCGSSPTMHEPAPPSLALSSSRGCRMRSSRCPGARYPSQVIRSSRLLFFDPFRGCQTPQPCLLRPRDSVSARRAGNGEGSQAPQPAAAAGGVPRTASSGLSSLSPDEAIHLLQSQVGAGLLGPGCVGGSAGLPAVSLLPPSCVMCSLRRRHLSTEQGGAGAAARSAGGGRGERPPQGRCAAAVPADGGRWVLPVLAPGFSFLQPATAACCVDRLR